MDPHELLRLSNGDYMMLTSPVTTGNSVTFTDATGTSHTNVNIVDCVIEEINSSGGLVWSWDAYNDHHLAPSETFLGGAPISSPGSAYDGSFDVYHCNSLDIDPTVSNPSQADVLLSARNTDAVYRIQRSGGTVRWKLGNDHAPAGSQLNAAKTTGDDHEPLLTSSWLTAENTLGGQHDARFQGGNAVSFYDDHTGQPTTPNGGRGVQLNIANNATATETSDFPAPDSSASSTATGSYRPNSSGAGDNVVGWGFRNALAMTEFNNAGTDLRDIYFNTTASSNFAGYSTYRFIKLPASAFSSDLLRQTSGLERSTFAPTAPGWNRPGELTLQSQFGTAGNITTRTSSASPGSGSIYTFWKGADNNLWYTVTADGGGTYAGPLSLGSGPLSGSPHAVSSAPGRVDVFWRGSDNGLWHDFFVQGSGWFGPKSVGAGGTMAGDPYPVIFTSTGIDVYWKGSDGNLWHEWYSDGHGWEGPVSLGAGPLGGYPCGCCPPGG